VPSLPRILFLVGFMGSGKSEVGRRVAADLGWSFEDTDRAVERERGQSVERIFQEAGEERFREAERAVLRELSGRVAIVVATGGGLFLDRSSRHLMKHGGATVWLDAGLETVRRRLGPGTGRPLWNATDPIALRAFYGRRRAVYALCDFRVDASADTPDEVAARVVRTIHAVYH